jgi:hypothetical protein
VSETDPTPPRPEDQPPDDEGEDVIETPDVAPDNEPDHALEPDAAETDPEAEVRP